MRLETRHIAGLVVLVAIGAVVLIAYATVWQPVFFGMLLCLGGVLGIILVLIALTIHRQAKTKETQGLSRVGKVLLLIGIFLLIEGAYYPIALGIRNLEVKRTQNFINALIPQLEEYEGQNGGYPAGIGSILTDDEDVPRLLQLNDDSPLKYDNRQYYFQQGATYKFQFYLPDGEWTVTD